MYNLSPSGDFLLEFYPDEPRLWVATGGLGHGFKFGSIIGSIILDRLDGIPSPRWSVQFLWSQVTRAPAAARPR